MVASMQVATLDVHTAPDGGVLIHLRGPVGADRAVELRQLLVHTVRRVRPLRLVIDLADVPDLDAINVGSVAAACHLGDDHQVAVFVDNPSDRLVDRLTAAGVPRQRLRHVAGAR